MAQARQRGLVPLGEDRARDPRSGRPGQRGKERLESVETDPVRLGHPDVEVGRVDRVAVDRDVDRLRQLAQLLPDAGLRDELDLRRVEVPRPEQRHIRSRDVACVDQHPQRHAPCVTRRRALGSVQVAVRVDPDDTDAPVPPRELAHRADVGTTTSAEDERASGKLAREGGILLVERLLRQCRRLGPRQRQRRGGSHRRAARVTPCARDAHEPGGELAAAGVTLVLRPDRDGRERTAVGAACAQRAHRSEPQWLVKAQLPGVRPADHAHADALVQARRAGDALRVDRKPYAALPTRVQLAE